MGETLLNHDIDKEISPHIIHTILFKEFLPHIPFILNRKAFKKIYLKAFPKEFSKMGELLICKFEVPLFKPKKRRTNKLYGGFELKHRSRILSAEYSFYMV